MSTDAAAIPAAVGEDWESPHGFTPSKPVSFLHSSHLFFPPSHLFSITTLKLSSAKRKVAKRGQPPGHPWTAAPSTGPHGRGETATENGNPIAAPQRAPSFPAGNVIFFQSGNTKKKFTHGSHTSRTTAWDESGQSETEMLLHGLPLLPLRWRSGDK